MTWCLLFRVGARVDAYHGDPGDGIEDTYAAGSRVVRAAGGTVLAVINSKHVILLLPKLLLEVSNPATQPRPRPRLVKG